MKHVFIVFQPCSDPWAGSDYIVEIYSDKDKALAHVNEFNRDKKYYFEKLYVEDYEVV